MVDGELCAVDGERNRRFTVHCLYTVHPSFDLLAANTLKERARSLYNEMGEDFPLFAEPSK